MESIKILLGITIIMKVVVVTVVVVVVVVVVHTLKNEDIYSTNCSSTTPSTSSAHIPATIEYKTLISKHGIYQNPTGYHYYYEGGSSDGSSRRGSSSSISSSSSGVGAGEGVEGRRVWGGGIIKIPQNQWLPWEIDLYIESEDHDVNQYNNHQHYSKNNKNISLLLVTESAHGENLTSITRKNSSSRNSSSSSGDSGSSGSGGGSGVTMDSSIIKNVYSGGPPPWLKEEEIQLYFPELTNALKIIANSKKKKNPNRVGAAWAERRKIEMMQHSNKYSTTTNNNNDNNNNTNNHVETTNWLPNFGRVFNSGPRRTTALEFRFEQSKKQS
eukprot:TRINITY_DN2176_c0_g1_i1.p1 TRINITY_DN2176_c0_g1~~TRINITY_DN2176_c0_g1_i1.p1  ORF type:complete len:328 (-),score=99.43 TRINITY_DN2176_c0_g1_i1:66-1049(-)